RRTDPGAHLRLQRVRHVQPVDRIAGGVDQRGAVRAGSERGQRQHSPTTYLHRPRRAARYVVSEQTHAVASAITSTPGAGSSAAASRRTSKRCPTKAITPTTIAPPRN